MTIMMIRVLVLATLVTLAMSADVVVDFESAPHGTYIVGQSFDTQGFTFTEGDNGNNSGAFANLPTGSCLPPCVSNGTTALGAFNSSAIGMTVTGGGTFDLLSFDLAGTFVAGGRNVSLLQVDGTLFGGGTVSTQFNVADPNAFATYFLPGTFADLVSVDFHGVKEADGGPPAAGPEFQLDNIDTNANAVPEPAAAFLAPLLLIGALGLWRRRRLLRRPVE